MNQIRVAIVEDDLLIREAFAAMLKDQDGIVLSGVFGDAEKFMHEIDFSEPDVVLMDIHLPGINGIECIKKIKTRTPQTQFLMCTVFEDEESIFNALKAGASGYILKNVTIDELVKHIREIYAGLSPMSGLIARKVIMHFQQPTMSDEARSLLSPREQEVLQYLSRGLRYKEIASKVNLSAETVRTHIRNIYIKLQVDNKTEAINKVYRR